METVSFMIVQVKPQKYHPKNLENCIFRIKKNYFTIPV